MKDIQSQPDFRRINIQKVGVKNISYPLTVLDQENTTQKTVATVNMYVNLPHHFKGTHMSRFVEILNRFHGEINLKNFHLILADMKDRLQAEAAHLEIDFPYFLKKYARSPRSTAPLGADQTPAFDGAQKSHTLTEYHCAMHGSLSERDDLVLTVQVPIYPPSPSQRESALPRSLGHWGLATVSVRLLHFIWIEDLIRMIETVTSHDLCWPSGDDEFAAASLEVEGITKALGSCLQKNTTISWFSITVKNYSEGCNTFASLEWPEEGTLARA
ncbi:MAG: GTP cyclohydrolase I FolE2 [Desulfobulbaceae bacterium]|nr:GTP cyclohydrolase I FolE2 [Desulfobulbaceae bacterium]